MDDFFYSSRAALWTGIISVALGSLIIATFLFSGSGSPAFGSVPYVQGKLLKHPSTAYWTLLDAGAEGDGLFGGLSYAKQQKLFEQAVTYCVKDKITAGPLAPACRDVITVANQQDY